MIFILEFQKLKHKELYEFSTVIKVENGKGGLQMQTP